MDEEIALTLPISEWRVVVQHLARGTYEEVFHIIAKLIAQGDPQIKTAQLRTAERDAEAARQAAQTPGAPVSVGNPSELAEPRAESNAKQIH